MAENRLPRALSDLLAQGEALLLPGEGFWRETGFKIHSPTQLAAAIQLVRDTERAFILARVAKLEANARRRSLDDTVWDFITRSRDQLAVLLGRKWSIKWCPISFPNYSLRIPQKFDCRMETLHAIGYHFRQHPKRECAELDLTAPRAEQLHIDLTTADNEVRHCRTRIRMARDAREAAVTALRRLMRFIIIEVSICLKKNDSRWLAFGLNPPALRRRRKGEPARKETAAIAGQSGVNTASHDATENVEAIARPEGGRLDPQQLQRGSSARSSESIFVPTTVDQDSYLPRFVAKTEAKVIFGRPQPELEIETDHLDERLLPVLAVRAPIRRKKSLFAWFLPSWN